MIIRVTNLDTGQLIRDINYDEFVNVYCNGDKQMAADFIRLMRHHPKNKENREKWTVIDDKE